MNLDELRQLPPEQALQAAAKDLSLPTEFFDRMWKQESGRGQAMRSPAGAEGHFGIMPKTRAVWEQRGGASYNPDDFYDGLYLAHATMQENLGKFKDPVDATRAYNSGWDPSKWGNPETVGYVNSLWGPGAATAQPLPSVKAGRPAKPGTPAADAVADAALNSLPFPVDGIDAARDSARQLQLVSEHEQARRDGVHVAQVFEQALRDPRVMPTWTVLNRFAEGGAPAADPDWDYMAHRDELEKGRSDEERAYLRENAVSAESAQRALGELEYRRSLDQTYADGGGFATFAGQMAAGLADPASLLAGVAAGKAFQVARIGLSPLGKVGAFAAENAAANVAIEGLADSMGEHKTSADYVMAAATGAAFSGLFARGVYRSAAEAEARALANGMFERAAAEQVDRFAKVAQDNPGMPPEAVARKVVADEADAIRTAVDEATGPQRLDRVVPEDVGREMADEFQGVEPETVRAAKESPELADDFQDTQVLPHTQDLIDQLRKGEVARQIRDTNGGVIKLSWSTEGNKLPKHGTIAEALTAIHTHPLATPADKRLATYLAKVMSADGLQMDIRFTAREGASNFDPNGPRVSINGADTGASAAHPSIPEHVRGLTKYGIYSVLHETVHAATFHRINAWEAAGDKLRPDQQRVMQQFEDLYKRFRSEVSELKKVKGRGTGALYASTNLHEFAAQMMTDRETRFVLSMMPGKTVAGRSTNALREFMSIIRRILGLDKKATAFDEGAKLVDQMIAMPIENVQFANGTPVFAAPPEVPTAANPIAAKRSRDTWGERMIAHAQEYLTRNPIDTERLKTLTMKIGGASDGLVLANSKNPLMQLVASLVTETTTGAAGRKPTVAIRSKSLNERFVGNAMVDYHSAYTVWRNQHGGSVAEDAFTGDVRRKFDQAVYEETLARRGGDYSPSRDKAVIEAADALEGLFERSRLAQVDAAVLGHGALPSSSKGYMPQSLDGAKLQAATTKDLALLHDGLAKQFQDRLGWDAEFARSFAPFYTERARRRAMGDKGLESLGAGGEGLQLVRDTLEEMGQDATLPDRARAAQSKLGQSHTRTRLDLDLRQELRPGLRMMDFYNTNPLVLARSYAKRTAGTVSLTEAGIHGIRGMRELRQAALLKKDGTQPTARELDAYDRVMAEVLGTPVAGEVISNGASNMALLVSLQRLGGLVFTQAAEIFNAVHVFGLKTVLNGIPLLVEKMGEVGRLKRGLPSNNHILTSMEKYGGGEFGMESYKMIAPLDAPDRSLAGYMDQPGLLTRALRAGGHLQSKLSGFRGLMAAQHRWTAEQITMRAIRMIRDGGDHIALRDMGFTPEVVQSMKGDIHRVAKWDKNDDLEAFDISQVSDARTAEAFFQAVHRGTSQIIQGTFIGERAKWMHNDYMRLLLQLRSFGLTATEKQWGRTRMNHGYAYAAGTLLGQMALVLPIHLARIQLAATGLPEDKRDKFIKDNLRPAALARATMNYASMSGVAADTLDILTGIAGGWGGKETQELLGARSGLQSTSVGKLVPAAGSVDTLARVIGGRTDLHTAIKQLPFSNLWYLLPAINLSKPD